MQKIIFGVLLGYGAYWALNTPKGRGMIRSTRTAVGQLEDKVNKALTPKEVEMKDESLQIK